MTIWRRIRAHWGAATWLRTLHVATGLLTGLLSAGVIATLVVGSVLLVWTVVVPVIAMALLFWTLPLFTALQRSRFAAHLDVHIAPLPRRDFSLHPLKWLVPQARALSTWRQLAYHLLCPLLNGLGSLALLTAWGGTLAMVFLAARAFDFSPSPAFGAAFALIGVGLFLAGPLVARAFTWVDVIAGEALLGPALSDELAQRVETLQESRAEVIDAADAERRRIERDLHDGTQQRLVWLAMNLGMARATLKDLPEPAMQVITQAHEESKQALKELRDLVRGLHPAVLTDEGLDAALSGLAARAPFPVRLSVDVAQRASPTIEAVAFFVVSETLTNIAKHAEATKASITVVRKGDRLRLAVRDDGRGGAAPERGSGLRGLAQRVGSVDGELRIDSPQGGPTTIEVELPCE
ncbi:sensor histidine kinase [Nonomuraea dietziae]|uniref:histidine kinase n=1 Tax=Nonomuraea dietziae TaxID=65515 RepID=A0A7W5YC25_9ACTN|nr:sensor histidine kinase [Nonomuraea dietziae]MBB3728828.1 signal transduction histidine kinase [Nonomuraea dietziae]